jgi:hypothetical protein
MTTSVPALRRCERILRALQLDKKFRDGKNSSCCPQESARGRRAKMWTGRSSTTACARCSPEPPLHSLLLRTTCRGTTDVTSFIAVTI